MAKDVEAAVRETVAPVVAALGCALYDVEVSGSGKGRTVRVLVDREGGVDLDAVTATTQVVSPALDACELLSGPYLLEVSSPGVERPLRRPEHFRAAVGQAVTVNYHTDSGPRRARGALLRADDHRVVVDEEGRRVEIAYEAITKARTVFEWGPQPRPGRSPGSGSTRARERTEGSRA